MLAVFSSSAQDFAASASRRAEREFEHRGPGPDAQSAALERRDQP